MTNQYVFLVVHQKPVVHKAHANAFIFFPGARNFLPLPILAALLSSFFFSFSLFLPSFSFFILNSIDPTSTGSLPLRFERRIQLVGLVPLEREFQRWWSMHRLIRRPARPRIRLHRGGIFGRAPLWCSRVVFFPPMLLVNARDTFEKWYPSIFFLPRCYTNNYNCCYLFFFFNILAKVRSKITNNLIHLFESSPRPNFNAKWDKIAERNEHSKIPIKAGDFGIRRRWIILSLYLQLR